MCLCVGGGGGGEGAFVCLFRQNQSINTNQTEPEPTLFSVLFPTTLFCSEKNGFIEVQAIVPYH